MREEVAKLVFPVLTTGLRRKEELMKGVSLEIENVQKELMGLLQAVEQTQAWVDPQNLARDFLGIRFALACWLDEIFLMPNCPWREQWKEEILEFKLFDTRHRAWKFWQQARLASKLAEPDALEVFYLCVELGFRGDLECQDAPRDGNIKVWCADARRQVDEARPPENLALVEKQPVTYVPELSGERKLKRALLLMAGLFLLLVPVLVVAVMTLAVGR